MSVGEFCNREVIVVNQENSIRKAAKLMRKFHVGDVVVVEEKNQGRIPIGILTDRDIVLGVIAIDVDIDSVTVGDVMSFELTVAKEEDDLMTTIKQMRSKGVRRIPVTNDRGTLAGILAVDDVLELLSEQLIDITNLITGGQQREHEKRP